MDVSKQKKIEETMMLNCTYTGIQKFTKHSQKCVCCYYRLFWQVRLKCSNVTERKLN